MCSNEINEMWTGITRSFNNAGYCKVESDEKVNKRR